LTKTAIELPGANCASGGFKLSTGLDSNANGVLETAETTSNIHLQRHQWPGRGEWSQPAKGATRRAVTERAR